MIKCDMNILFIKVLTSQLLLTEYFFIIELDLSIMILLIIFGLDDVLVGVLLLVLISVPLLVSIIIVINTSIDPKFQLFPLHIHIFRFLLWVQTRHLMSSN